MKILREGKEKILDKKNEAPGEFFLKETFEKLNFNFSPKKKILDVGCGGGAYSNYFVENCGMDAYAIDIYKDNEIKKYKKIKFKTGSIYDIKYKNNFFDYVFLHDVLHHIDEESQSFDNHIKAMNELKRVVKKSGNIIIVEANRYNFLFYPHMVKMRGHNHWRQSYFKKLIRLSFPENKYSVSFKHFEAHVYPWGRGLWKIYEQIIERLRVNNFMAYNVCIISKN